MKVFYYVKVYVSKGGRKYTIDIEAYLQNIETWLFFSHSDRLKALLEILAKVDFIVNLISFNSNLVLRGEIQENS